MAGQPKVQALCWMRRRLGRWERPEEAQTLIIASAMLFLASVAGIDPAIQPGRGIFRTGEMNPASQAQKGADSAIA